MSKEVSPWEFLCLLTVGRTTWLAKRTTEPLFLARDQIIAILECHSSRQDGMACRMTMVAFRCLVWVAKIACSRLSAGGRSVSNSCRSRVGTLSQLAMFSRCDFTTHNVLPGPFGARNPELQPDQEVFEPPACPASGCQDADTGLLVRAANKEGLSPRSGSRHGVWTSTARDVRKWVPKSGLQVPERQA